MRKGEYLTFTTVRYVVIMVQIRIRPCANAQPRVGAYLVA